MRNIGSQFFVCLFVCLQCHCLFLFQSYAGLIKQVEKFSLFLLSERISVNLMLHLFESLIEVTRETFRAWNFPGGKVCLLLFKKRKTKKITLAIVTFSAWSSTTLGKRYFWGNLSF